MSLDSFENLKITSKTKAMHHNRNKTQMNNILKFDHTTS